VTTDDRVKLTRYRERATTEALFSPDGALAVNPLQALTMGLLVQIARDVTELRQQRQVVRAAPDVDLGRFHNSALYPVD